MSITYIAGPMTGLPAFNFPAFDAKAAELRAQGRKVENPADNGVHEQFTWEDYMRMAVAQLVTCDVIHMLPGWSKSKGATIEHGIAVALGMTIEGADQ